MQALRTRMTMQLRYISDYLIEDVNEMLLRRTINALP